jgi:hypothetical protein
MELHFLDIVNIALDINVQTEDIIELLKLMRNAIQSCKHMKDGADQLNYTELFRIFVKLRKVKLLRYLFNQKLEFEFKTSIFLLALEEEAYDMAVLLHKEFQYLMRDNSLEENKQIVSFCVASMNKTNSGAGMIEYKSFLIRQFLDYFTLRHARALLDAIDKRVSVPSKFNLFV